MDDKSLTGELTRIVHDAEEQGVILRGLGAAAVKHHCPIFAEKRPTVSRPLTDLDLITYSSHEERALKVLEKAGYAQDRARQYIRSLSGRSMLENHQTHLVIDLFFDELAYNHTLNLRGRLERDAFTLPLADLLLEKTQIVLINEKDVKDTILLLLEHDVGQGDHETINTHRICAVLSDDWGFYYTVTTNLERVADYLKRIDGLTGEDIAAVNSRLQKLKTSVESAPKTMRWKLRSRVGVKKKWYNDVEELYAGH